MRDGCTRRAGRSCARDDSSCAPRCRRGRLPQPLGQRGTSASPARVGDEDPRITRAPGCFSFRGVSHSPRDPARPSSRAGPCPVRSRRVGDTAAERADTAPAGGVRPGSRRQLRARAGDGGGGRGHCDRVAHVLRERGARGGVRRSRRRRPVSHVGVAHWLPRSAGPETTLDHFHSHEEGFAGRSRIQAT